MWSGWWVLTPYVVMMERNLFDDFMAACVSNWAAKVSREQTRHLPSMAYFMSWANNVHMTSADTFPTLSSCGNLKEKKKSVNRQSTINTTSSDGQEYKCITSEWWWHWWHISDVIYWNKKNQLRVGSNRDSGSVLVQYWSEFQDWTINKKLHLHTNFNWRSSCSCRQAPGVTWRSDQLWSTNKKNNFNKTALTKTVQFWDQTHWLSTGV